MREKHQLRFCEELQCPIHNQFTYTMSFKLPLILTEVLQRWRGRQDNEITWPRPLNPGSPTLKTALGVSTDQEVEKCKLSPHLLR